MKFNLSNVKFNLNAGKQAKKLGAGLAALAVVVAGGGYYYFHVHNDTPDRVIKTITRAIDEHDVKEFHRNVDVDGVLDSGYEGFVDGVTSAAGATTDDAKDAIKNFTQILREPMMTGLKEAIDSYVATGDFDAEKNIGALEMLERTGLNNVKFIGVKNVQLNDADRDEAFADVIIFQPELGNEFAFQVVMRRDDDRWKVVRVQNFRDYVAQITKARRVQLEDYLKITGEINISHELVIRDFEQKYSATLAAGNLGNDKTRAELKQIILNIFQKDWETRKRELFSVHVPKDAQTLHNLYMRISDLWISAAQDYAKWMDDKNAATIKSAEEKIHQAQTLTSEAAALAKRMTG